ncbi:MAG: hypothetical protein ABIP75_04520 [Pyrinomonadaceae bacterium]
MFCPQCSQAQTNLELKFCSRCGFPLHGVKDLMANGGELTSQITRDGIRAKAVRRFVQGLAIIICSLMFGGVLKVLGREYGFSGLIGELTILIGFLIGALRLLTAMVLPLSRISSKRLESTMPKGSTTIDGVSRTPMLSDAKTRPIGYEPPLEREPVLVPSVTEHTTRSLDSRELPGVS